MVECWTGEVANQSGSCNDALTIHRSSREAASVDSTTTAAHQKVEGSFSSHYRTI
jgi:hypothetical protein